jgi:alkanesulfonate monooxygenase SsuD/methylene tetrahydromethanopterin reductase-like flavin-dependent oxidoreductase (luciferase family)
VREKPAGVPEGLAGAVERFLGWMKKEKIDPDLDYGRFYENYFLRMRKEHLDLFEADTIRAIAGAPEECVERVRRLEEAGVTDFAIVLDGNSHELMTRFSRQVIGRWR